MNPMRTLLCSVLALAGCDNVFRLSPVPEPKIDASIENPRDADIDAAATACMPGFVSPGDFDGDSSQNHEDNCPNLAASQIDTDTDGLGDYCDPHPTVAGDCILFFDTFANLDCWQTYEAWSTCGTGVCSPMAMGTLDLKPAITSDSAVLYGDVLASSAGGPTVSLMLGDATAGVARSGYACEAYNNSDNIGVSTVEYTNDTGNNRYTSATSPPQTVTTPGIAIVVAWVVQDAVTPYYACDVYTQTNDGPGYGRVYATQAPGGTSPVIRTEKTLFRPTLFMAYGVGTQCDVVPR
jgi:hypothetical protein